MSLTASEIIQIMEKAKELGVNAIKAEGIEASFAPAISTAAPRASMQTPERVTPIAGANEPTDEEMLYWATPYYDELQAQKEHRNKLKEESELTRG